MTATVAIVTDQAEDVIIIPNRVMHLDEVTRTPYVEKLLNGVPTRVDVVIGLRNEQYSEIQQGLEEGDVLVIRRINTGDILRKQIFGGG
jgi:macrolide-specific efflux system membrane fusion protein